MAQTILIVGASRGIGLEMARQAAAGGDHVIATTRSDAGAAALSGVAAEVLRVDITDEPGLIAASGSLDATIDLMVINAGIYRGRGGIDADDTGPDAWAETLMTNVAGPFFAVRAFLPRMASPGKIAIISSQMGANGLAAGNGYIYRASKAGATNLASNLAIELAPKGIAVGAYHPGWVRTDMGGAEAAVSPEDSAAGLLARFQILGPETTGVFEDYAGAALPY